MANLVSVPASVPYRYGLTSVAEPIEIPGSLRLVTDYAFDSVSCNEGFIWEPACGPEFTVTFTKSATADTYNVTTSSGVLADYEVSVNNGAFTALTATVVSTDAAPTPVTVREVSGLQRFVTISDVDFDAATGTVETFQSEQTANSPKPVTEGIDSAVGSPFVVGARVNCTLIAGYDFLTLARQAMVSVENRLVEQRFWAKQLATASPELPAGTTAQSIKNGVGVLEEYMRDTSGLEGVLHSSSYLGAHAPVVDENGEVKYTTLHTGWAFGGGYPRTGPTGQAAPTATQAWIFGTGPVQIVRGEVFIPGDIGENFNSTNNQEILMAERTYAVLHDCPIAAVLVDTSV